MKRNLSSHIIKAMTIGMAFAMGTTTVMSGVVVNKPVMAYAQTQQKSLKGDGSYYNEIGASLKANDYVKTSDGLLFQVNADGNTLTFLGGSTFNTEATQYSLDGSTQDKAYLVTYSNGTVILTPGVDKSETTINTNINGKTLSFKADPNTKTATLIGVTNAGAYKEEGVSAPILENGVLKTSSGEYTFTTIGDGSTALSELDVNVDLVGNLNNVTTVAANASLKTATNKIELPNVTKINNGAFANTTTALTLPALTTVPTSAFNGLSNLTEVNLPNATTLEAEAFKGASSLTNITLPNVTTIPTNAFSGSSLTHITLPNVTTIEAEAFKGASSLTNLDLGDNDIAEIPEDAFSGLTTSSITITTNSAVTEGALSEVATGATVENKAPEIISAELNEAGNQVTLKFSEKIKLGEEAEANTVAGYFTVKHNTSSTEKIPSSMTFTTETDTMILNLDESIPATDVGTVKLSYTDGGASSIVDLGTEPKNLVNTSSDIIVKDNFVVPTIQSGEVVEGKIVLNFDIETTGLQKEDFNVTIGGTEATISNATPKDKQVTLEISGGVAAGKTVVVSPKTAKVKGTVIVKNAPAEITLPTISTKTATNDTNGKITLTLSSAPYESLNNNDINDFTLKVDEDSSYSISSISTNGKEVILTLNKPLKAGQTIKLTYTGSKINSNGEFVVDNEVTAPAYSSVSTLTDEKRNEFIIRLNDNSQGVDLNNSDIDQFEVKVGGQAATISTISTKGNDVTVTLQNPVKHSQAVTVKYTGNKISGLDTEKTVENNISFSQENVTATLNEGGNQIVLKLDTSKTVAGEPTESDTGFTLSGSGTESITVQSAVVDDSQKTITLTLEGGTLSNVEGVTLSYTAKGDNPIKVDNKNLSLSGLEIKAGEEPPVDDTVEIHITEATANGKIITLKTTETLTENTLTDSNFEVTQGGAKSPLTVSSVKAKANSIVIVLQDILADGGQALTVTYNGNDANLVSEGKKVKAFEKSGITNSTVKNNDNIAIATPANNQIKLTAEASEAIEKAGTPVKEDFKLSVSSKDSIKIDSIDVSNISSNGILITLSGGTLANDDVITLSYAPTDDENALQIDTAGGSNFKSLVLNGDTHTVSGLSEVYSAPVMMSERAVATSTRNATLNGNVTTIKSITGATEAQVQKVLTSKLTKIETGAFKNAPTMKLDFTNVDVNNLTIETGAFDEKGNVTFVCDDKAKAETLASKLETSGVKDVVIKDSSGNEIVKPEPEKPEPPVDNGGSSSGSSGGGANIGVSVEDNNQNNNNNNNSGNVTNPTFENKDLTFDVISLPSVDGEPKVFGDIAENHWAKSHIDKLSTAGIINGIDGNFQPNGQTKRADATIMLVKLLGLSTEGGNRFADVDPNAYYAPYVNTAATYGIVNGSNGMFNPNGIISRQDTMVMIAQILKGLDLNVNTDTTALNQFSDAANVSGYAQESVAILINSGIITGNNGKLNPTAPVTRAEMATIMSKLYDVLASANK